MPFDPSQPFEIVEETPKETWSGVAKNTAIDAVKGVVSLGEGVVGIADLATGNLAGKGLSKVGYDPAKAKEIVSEGYTPRRKQANKEVSKAGGFFGTVEALIDYPSVAFGAIVESAPMTASGVAAARYVAVKMLGSALTANGIKAGSGAARTFATKFFADPKVQTKLVLAGAGTEGAQTAGLIQEQGRQGGREYSETVGPALAAGAGTAAIGGLTSKIPGFRDAEASLATAGIGGQFSAKKVPANIARGIVKEGPLEEMPQSAQEQAWTNVAMGDPVGEGVPEAAATGMVVGAAQGGGMITASELMNSFKANIQPIDKEKTSNLGTIAQNIAEVEREVEAKEIIDEIAPIIGTPIGETYENTELGGNKMASEADALDLEATTGYSQESALPVDEEIDAPAGEVPVITFDPAQPFEVVEEVEPVAEFRDIYYSDDIETAANDLVSSQSTDEINSKLDSIFGANEQAEQAENGEGEYTIMHDIALDRRADLEYAARNRYTEEVRDILKAVRDEERRFTDSVGQAGARNVQPTAEIPPPEQVDAGLPNEDIRIQDSEIEGGGQISPDEPTGKAVQESYQEEDARVKENNMVDPPKRDEKGNKYIYRGVSKDDSRPGFGLPRELGTYWTDQKEIADGFSQKGGETKGAVLPLSAKRLNLDTEQGLKLASEITGDKDFKSSFEDDFDNGHEDFLNEDHIKALKESGIDVVSWRNIEGNVEFVINDSILSEVTPDKASTKAVKQDAPPDKGGVAGVKIPTQEAEVVFSRSGKTQDKTQPTPLTEKQQKIFDRLQKTGRVKVVSAAEAEKILGDATVLSKDGRKVEAFTLPDSSVYLIQENIKDLWPVIRHEVAVHSRRLLLSNETFSKLLKSLETRQRDKSATGDAIRAAMAKVPESTNPEHYLEEILAYMVTGSPQVGIVRRFIAMLKNTLVRMGFNPGMFTAADISALAESTLRRDVGVSAIAEFAQDAKLSVQAAGNKITDNPAFRKWFGDSVVTVDGKVGSEPLVVYHGGTDNIKSFREGANFFTSNPGIANIYSKARSRERGKAPLSIPVYLSIKNPYLYNREVEKITVEEIFDTLGYEYDGLITSDSYYIPFNPNQIKSIFNKGAFDPTNPDIRFSLSATDDYAENRAITKNYKNQVLRKVREAGRNIVGGLDKYLGATSTRLRKINPKIESKIRELDFRIGKNSADDVKAIQGMLQKAKAMTADDFKDWDYARKNGDTKKINELVDKYNLKAEYENYRKTLDKIRAEAIDVGLDVGFIEEYSPRILKDAEGFLLAIGKEKDWDIISRRLKKRAEEIGIPVHDMTPEMRADIISNMMHGGFGLSGPAGAKERKVKKIPPHLNQYYMHSDAALVNYLHSMRKAIEARRFFGKVPEKISTAKRNLHRNMTLLAEENKKPEPNEKRIETLTDNIAEYRREIEKYKYQRDFTENIGAYIDELLINKEITPEQENTLVALLTARFHEKGTHGLIQAYKNFSYIDTMGSPISAITQIGDLAWAVYENGWGATSKAVINSIRKSSRIVKEDVGIERIAQEFADSDTLSNAVAKVFKWVGLEKMDAIGKEAMLNGALEKFEKRAQVDPGKLKAEIHHMFEGETDSVIADLQNKKVSDNVKFLIYSKLLDYQPVGLSEMSEMYLQAGNGRLFYMLKSYTLKQFDVFRREGYEKIKNGTKAEKIEAIRKTIYLASLLVLANAGADELKDLVLGRKTSLSDRVTDNVLRLFGVSKFVTWKARTDGAGSAVVRQILPPFKFIDSVSKDVVSAGDGKGLYTTQSVPIVGKLAYWHMGRGQTSRLELYEKRFSSEKKKLKEIKEIINLDPKKAASYSKEMNRLSRVNIFQKKLTKNKKQINELKKRQKLGMKVGGKIKKMEDERAEMIKQFLSGLD